MKKKDLKICLIILGITILYTLIVKFIDVKAIGPKNSEVGLATINSLLTFKYNKVFYIISKITGYIPFLIILIYAFIGFLQLLEKKSLFKVDRELLILGTFYIVVGIVYIFFEKVVINYRPVLLEGLEASYPSSHTVLALTICGSSLIINNSLFKKKKFVKYENIVSKILIGVIVVSRLMSGVHWFTDIVGGILISITLLKIFDRVIKETQ